MPFYEYECSNCKFYVEALQKISDEPLRECPSCKKKTLKKLVSAPVFRLKGSGWYETDFKSEGEDKRNLADREEPAEKSEDKSSDTKSDSAADKGKEKKVESKPVVKTGTGKQAPGKTAPTKAAAARGKKPTAKAPAKRPPARKPAPAKKKAKRR
ncbi:MAG TPA: zinc ribbon domain-containing protein [Steroidobacter sp.]|uniref:FmdB family zinc ribbon protein n=1 Tax=Steroidobacter sp. TaxID=1978227 RepID=UPI002EDA1B75